MATPYPEVEPYDGGMLDVGDRNVIHWETYGKATGKPALVLHGGPGSGSSASMARYFDPAVYQVVMFDQRGCGRSIPHASEPGTDLSVNTTEHLLADIELLRNHLNVERWLVFGVSWGCTLGLAYAERHPLRVSQIILAGVTMTRRSEIDWLCRGVARLFPQEWARFRAGAREHERDGDLVEAYHRLLQHDDPAVCAKAAKDWSEWERALTSSEPGAAPESRWSDPAFLLARARIVTHYFRHNAWLEDGILLKQADALAGIAGVLINGRLDVQAPLITAWELAEVWGDCELVIVPGAGHLAADRGMSEAIVDATRRFAGER